MFVIAPGWEQTMRQAGLDSFERVWQLDHDWIEAPNERRRGWSGVVRRNIDSDNGPVPLFIKRQQGQNRRTLTHLRSRPTYFFEYRFLQSLGKEFPQLVGYTCYGERHRDGVDQAVLATIGLLHYRDLNALAAEASRSELKSVLAELHQAVLPLHLARLQHGALYAAHIFAHNESRAIKLIDLERVRFRARKRAAARADLRQFINRTDWLDEDLLATLIAPWEKHFPGIRAQLPPTRRNQNESGHA